MENSINKENISEFSVLLENFAQFDFKDHTDNYVFAVKHEKKSIVFSKISMLSNIDHKKTNFFIIAINTRKIYHSPSGRELHHDFLGKIYAGKNPSLFSKLDKIFLRERIKFNEGVIIREGYDSYILVPDSRSPEKKCQLPNFLELQE